MAIRDRRRNEAFDHPRIEGTGGLGLVVMFGCLLAGVVLTAHAVTEWYCGFGGPADPTFYLGPASILLGSAAGAFER